MARLLVKLPHDLRPNFRRSIYPQLCHWLEFEIQIQIDITGSGPGHDTNERERREARRWCYPSCAVLRGGYPEPPSKLMPTVSKLRDCRQQAMLSD